MSKIIVPELKEKNPGSEMLMPIGRTAFLKYLGVSAALTALTVTGCKEKNPSPISSQGVDLGSGDFGILNYAYALEQLEAAFYLQVIATKYSGMNAAEEKILTEIRDHEVLHRDFLKAALGTNAIPALEVDFSTINFGNRASVLGTAKAFEDLGVAAYNGAGQLLADANYLLIAGKIVSVEARHAAVIRDLLNPFSVDFSGDDVVAANGLDAAKTPGDVLATAKTYIKTPINFSNLPKN